MSSLPELSRRLFGADLQGKPTMADLRRARRLIMRVPMRVKTLDNDASQEETVECMNISLRGTYFSTELPLKEGSDIEVRLKMPEEVVAGQKHEWTFIARVVHLEQLGNYRKRSGVGVHFLYYSAE